MSDIYERLAAAEAARTAVLHELGGERFLQRAIVITVDRRREYRDRVNEYLDNMDAVGCNIDFSHTMRVELGTKLKNHFLAHGKFPHEVLP